MELEKVIISMNDLRKYNELREQGFVVQWCGEGKLCLVRPKDWQERIKD